MTETEFRETASSYGYTDDEINELISEFRDKEAELTGKPIPFEDIPIFYKGY